MRSRELASLAKSPNLTDGAFRTYVVLLEEGPMTLLKLKAVRKVKGISNHVVSLEKQGLIKCSRSGKVSVLDKVVDLRKMVPPTGENTGSAQRSGKKPPKKLKRVSTSEVGDAKRSLPRALRAIQTDERFIKSPSLKVARKELEEAKSLPPDEWSSVAITGYYITQWEKWSRRPWRASRSALGDMFKQLDLLVRRTGKDDTIKAIKLVFGKGFNWCDNKLGLLTGRDGYAKHIVPALVKQRTIRKGEQSEWTGRRSNKKGNKKVTL